MIYIIRSKLVSIPFPTRRATFNEVKRVHEVLMTIELHRESVEEMRNKLLCNEEQRSSRIGTKTAKTKNIRRSKSRETPKRELPDFVQNLANEAASQSEDDETVDLQEFEFTKKLKKPSKRDHTVELQNALGESYEITYAYYGENQILPILGPLSSSSTDLRTP